MPLANQLNKGFDLGGFVDDFKRARQHIIGIGLGAQSSTMNDCPIEVAFQLSQGTREWLKNLIEKLQLTVLA